MQPQTPSSISNQDEYNKSLFRVLFAGLSTAAGNTFDANGQPLTFEQDNMAGTVIRIGSTANPNGLANHWPAANTDLTIAHNLGVVPFGAVAIAKYAAADVWFGTIPPDKTNITLQTSNAATDITVWILA